MIKKLFSRRQLLVDKKFQSSFILAILIALIVIIILISILIVYSTSQKIGEDVYSKIVTLKHTNEIIIPTVIKVSTLIFILSCGIIIYNLLIYTNRIVGPMVRFKRSLHDLGNGDFTVNIKFRNKDKLKDLGSLLSQTVAQLNKKMRNIKN